MKRWQTIVLCAVLAGANACGGLSSDFVDPRRGDVGGGGGLREDGGALDPDPDAGPSDFDAGPGWPGQGDGGLVIPQPHEEEPGPGECGASSFEAEKIVVQREVEVESEITITKPVALYVLFDKSRSMGPVSGYFGGQDLWDPAVAAFKSFMSEEKSKDIGVGIQYFPKSGGNCSTGAGFSTPAVAVAPLPGNAAAVAKSLDDENPTGVGAVLPWGGTPIEGALRGATQYCKQYQADHEDEQCVAVLVTDGKPEYANGCSENHTTLANIAKDAKGQGVTTFAVGLKGAEFSLLDKIAQEGGAPDCDPNSARYACDVSSGPSKLSEALAKIRDTVVKTETKTVIETVVEETTLPCEWAIPEQPEGRAFDPDKVNVRLTAGGEETTFVRVPSRDACEGDAWHFDDSAAPTRLVACPAACDHIESKQGKIDILLGCQTLTPQ